MQRTAITREFNDNIEMGQLRQGMNFAFIALGLPGGGKVEALTAKLVGFARADGEQQRRR